MGRINQKKYWVGIDIGSVSVDGAIIGRDKIVIKDFYMKHKGQPLTAVMQLLRDVMAVINFNDIQDFLVTGSGGKLVAALLDIEFINEIVVRAEANITFNPEIRTIIEIGGEDSRFISITMDESINKVVIGDFGMNHICAAGTGAFLEQQASRLGIKIEDFGQLALKSKHPARIAGRCSVFAKTDMIHLQQNATPIEDILAGLCYALAINFKSSVAKGKDFNKPISFQGGVAANQGVVKAFADILGVGYEDIIIPEHYSTLGAIGAALTGLKYPEKSHSFQNLEEIEKLLNIHKEQETTFEPLIERDFIDYKNDSALSEKLSKYSDKIPAYLGIDVGSISTNIVILDDEGNLLWKRYLMTAGKPVEAVIGGLKELNRELGQRLEVKGVCTTGSARYLISDIVGADVVKNEISAQAKAAIHIDQNVDTIFEIGGQDSKYISIKDGIVIDFEMNKVCAAGTGSFLEEQAERLNMDIKGEFSELAFKAQKPVELGERCTVFMQSDIGHFQAQGTSRENMAAGLCYSIVHNYLHRVVEKRPIGNNIFFQGGVAFNKGVCAAFESVLEKKITVPPNQEVTGAIGCALYARENVDGPSRFNGFGIVDKKYEFTSFFCEDCSNRCEISNIVIEGVEKPLCYGSRCGKFDEVERKQSSNIPDLFAERETWMLEAYAEAKLKEPKSHVKVGIPRSMLLFYELFPFWSTFFSELGFDLVLSEKTQRKIVQDALENTPAEYCFPTKLLFGHVINLINKKIDYIFLPSIISLHRQFWTRGAVSCPYIFNIPYITEAALEMEKKGIKVLQPIFEYTQGMEHIENVTADMCKQMNISRKSVALAFQPANKNQEKFLRTIKNRGKEIIDGLGEDEIAVIVIGRLYNTCDQRINLGINQILMERDITAIPIDFLSLEDEESSKKLLEEWPIMCWQVGQRILKAAQYIREKKNLYAVYLTNFGCGPDSYIVRYFNTTMRGKPFLAIEVDEHGADVGVITRVEAFLDSLETIRKREKQKR